MLWCCAVVQGWLGAAEGGGSVRRESEGGEADSEETSAARDVLRIRETKAAAAQRITEAKRGAKTATQLRVQTAEDSLEFVAG